MKKHLILGLVGAMMLLAACGGGTEPAEETDTTANVEVRNTDGLKIAFYNQDSLRIYYDYYREIDSALTIKGMSFQNEVQRQSTALQNYIASSQQKANSGLLSENELIQIQNNIQQKEAALMDYQQRNGAALEAETMNEMDAIGNKIQAFAQSYSEENGIDILLIHAMGGQLGYIHPSMDVTMEFTEYLNQKTAELLNELEN